MAILTRWDNKGKTIILLEFESEWSWEDLEGAVSKSDRLIGSVPHMVDLIIDVGGAAFPLSEILSKSRALLAAGDARPNEGVRVVVGANGIMRTAYQTYHSTFQSAVQGREVLFADSLLDARAIIRGLAMDR